MLGSENTEVNETDRSHPVSSNILCIGRHTKTKLWDPEEMTRTLWERIVVGIEMRPHQGRMVEEGLSVTFNLKLKDDVEQAMKRRKPCKQREQYEQRA